MCSVRATVIYATEAQGQLSTPEWDLQVVGSVSAGAQKGSNWGCVKLLENLSADFLELAESESHVLLSTTQARRRPCPRPVG
jgi:hypothetical protein